jgi:hypothetical protein
MGQPLRLSKWRISLFDKKDFSELQSLFKQSFNKDLSPELRQWKYADKQAFALCTWNGSSLIGHYGGIPRDILFFGDPKKAIQMGDAMVDPSYRGGLSRKGPFFMMVTTVIQDYIGFNKLFLVGFGCRNSGDKTLLKDCLKRDCNAEKSFLSNKLIRHLDKLFFLKYSIISF